MENSSADHSQQHDAVNSALSLAIERKDMQMITVAMNRGADAKPLLEAGMAQENMGMISLALDKGADANTLLFAGISRGRPLGEHLKDFFNALNDTNSKDQKASLSWVTTAISHGADVNASQKGWPAIHWAHGMFNKDIMDVLIQAGATVDAPSPQGTPLMRAVTDGKAKLVEYYLNHGADPTCLCGPKGNFPMRALERSDNFMKGKKASLLLMMMQNMPGAKPDAAPSPVSPAPAADPVSTAQDIEVSAPLALKVPPPHEPPAKTFSL